MAGSILDDVKLLLMKKAGDPKILERIKRAAENNEVISIYEREYVGNLAGQHLDPARAERKARVSRKEPKEKPVDARTSASRYDGNYARDYALPKMLKRRPKTDMKITILVTVAAAAIAISVISTVSLELLPFMPADDDRPPTSGDDNRGGDMVTDPVVKPPPEPEYIIGTDQLSYGQGDIVTISGTANHASGDVDVILLNPGGDVIWNGEGVVTDDGSFLLLLLAGGAGWEGAGEYAVVMQQDGRESRSTFFFIP